MIMFVLFISITTNLSFIYPTSNSTMKLPLGMIESHAMKETVELFERSNHISMYHMDCIADEKSFKG